MSEPFATSENVGPDLDSGTDSGPGPDSGPGFGLDYNRRVLRERARALALAPEPEEHGDDVLHIVEFTLAGERHALEAVHVQEVLVLEQVARVPCTPAFVHGIINLRGRILSIIDMRVFFELPREQSALRRNVLVLSSRDMEMGVLADQVVGAYPLPRTTIHPPSPDTTGIRAAYLHGVVGADLIVLDALKLLRDPALVVNEEPGLS